MAIHEKLGTLVPKGALFTCVVAYANTPFAAGTIQALCVAPFDAKVHRVDMVNNVAVTDGPSVVSLSIDGASAFDASLSTGAGTIGLVDTYEPAPADKQAILQGETLEATSEGDATLGDVILCVTLQKTES